MIYSLLKKLILHENSTDIFIKLYNLLTFTIRIKFSSPLSFFLGINFYQHGIFYLSPCSIQSPNPFPPSSSFLKIPNPFLRIGVRLFVIWSYLHIKSYHDQARVKSNCHRFWRTWSQEMDVDCWVKLGNLG